MTSTKSTTNPYQTPPPAAVVAGTDFQPVSYIKVAVWLLAYLYPVWLAVSFYMTWLIAWVQLGYRPRPMLDDPDRCLRQIIANAPNDVSPILWTQVRRAYNDFRAHDKN